MSVDTYPNCTTCCGGDVVDTPCCRVDLPTVLDVTVTGKTGTCTCLPDSFIITWNVSTQKWESGPLCGTNVVTLKCIGTTASEFQLETFGALFDLYSIAPGASCDPLNLVFTGTLFTICVGDAVFTVTE